MVLNNAFKRPVLDFLTWLNNFSNYPTLIKIFICGLTKIPFSILALAAGERFLSNNEIQDHFYLSPNKFLKRSALYGVVVEESFPS